MSATTMPPVSTTEKAGWGTRALAILIDAIGVGIIAGAVSHDKIAGTYVVKA